MADEPWQEGSLAERNLHMLDSEYMADCAFVVGIPGETVRFRCHKYALCQACSVFDRMFNGEMPPQGDVRVDDIVPQTFRKMLEFIYTLDTNLENVDLAMRVYRAAHKYMINRLTLNCSDFIKQNMDKENVCRALELAHHYENVDLEAKCVKYLQTNTHEVFNSASFPEAQRATLLTILNQNNLCIASEVEVFLACIRWAEAQAGGANVSLREVLGSDLLSLIRFLTMHDHEFNSNVVPRNLLEAQEVSAIQFYFVRGPANIPQGISTNTEIRAPGSIENIEIDTRNRISFSGERIATVRDFHFSMNIGIYISGLQLLGLGGSPRERPDSFEIDLLLDNVLLTSATFEGLMSTERTVKVSFQRLCLLEADNLYTLRLRYNGSNTLYLVTDYIEDGVYSSNNLLDMHASYSFTTISNIYFVNTPTET